MLTQGPTGWRLRAAGTWAEVSGAVSAQALSKASPEPGWIHQVVLPSSAEQAPIIPIHSGLSGLSTLSEACRGRALGRASSRAMRLRAVCGMRNAYACQRFSYEMQDHAGTMARI